MRAIEFHEQNTVYAENQPPYTPLPVYKKPGDPQGLVVSKWSFHPDDLKRVFETGAFHLAMLTFNQPLQPLLLTVDFPENPDPLQYESQTFSEILAEVIEMRKKQISKGRTIEQDLQLNYGTQLSYVAGFLCHSHLSHLTDDQMRELCPPNWQIGLFVKYARKPYRERLVVAAALIVAELDRLDNGGSDLIYTYENS